MADEKIATDDFNDLRISSLTPAEPEPVPAAPEVPAAEPVTGEEPTDPSVSPQAVIQDFLARETGQQEARTFAEKRRRAEQDLAAKQAEIERIAQSYEGAEEVARILADRPDLLPQLQQMFYGGQPVATPSPYVPQPPAARPFTAPPARSAADDPRVSALEAKVNEQERRLMNANLHAATSIVQGRHHLTQGDMATVLQTAVSRGWFRPGMLQGEVEQVLEDARTIAFASRERANGQRDVLDRAQAAQKAVTVGGGATAQPKPVYDTRGKSLSQIRADAVRAGARGL